MKKAQEQKEALRKKLRKKEGRGTNKGAGGLVGRTDAGADKRGTEARAGRQEVRADRGE
jgi:hypothetical protein